MRNSCCRLTLAGALLIIAFALPSSATAGVFDPLAPASVQGAPTVTTDKADYGPNSPVILTGSGWQPGEKVHIVVNDDGLQQPVWQHTAWVKANASGNITDTFDLPIWLVANYTVTATGQLSGTAHAAFTDAYVERGCGPVAATIVVDTTNDDFDTAEDCSLREAIDASNENALVTDITVPAGTYTLTIPKNASNEDDAGGDLDVRSSVSINGAGPGATIVEGGATPGTGVDRVFHQIGPAPIDFDLNDLTIRHGFANTAGGGIRAEDGSIANPSELNLDNVLVTLNRMTSGNGGAGLYVVAANIDTSVQNSDFIDNDTASNCTGCDGGAIFNRGRSLDIDDSHLDMNSAGGKAGGLWNTNGGLVTIDDSTVNDNENNNAGADDLDGFGGGIYQADEDSFMTITNSEVNGNTAQGRGGGIYITNGHLVIDRSEVNDNTLDGARDGGGIFSSSALESPPAVQIIDSTVARNTTGRSGGGYFDNQNTNHDSLLIKQSTFNDNTAVTDGGGLHIRMDATIANTTIDNNHAGAEGGGLWLVDRDITLKNVTISDNDAPTGAGLRRDGGAPNDGDYFLSNTIVDNNACSAEVNINNPITAAFNNVTHNLDSGTSCGFGSANGSQSTATADLGPLQDNGGPTFTRAISVTSDALDAGDDPTCAAAPVDAIDQRHVPRPQGPHCDIGAYELAATIRGIKFEDTDGAGPGTTGPPLKDWVINAFADDGTGADTPEDGIIGPDEAAAGPVTSDTTDANGAYALALSVTPSTPPPGQNDYVICEELQAGWTQSYPDLATFTGNCDAIAGAGDKGYRQTDLEVGDDLTDNDFGNFESAATVSGLKYDDVNEANGYDAGDTPLKDWVINAYADTDGDGVINNGEENDPPAATDTTAADGTYSLTLAAGKYVICEELQADWLQKEPDPSNAKCKALDDPVAEGGHEVDLSAGASVPNKNFGNYAALVTGIKFNDDEPDGDKTGDSPLGGWVIKAFRDDGGPGATDTAADQIIGPDEAAASPLPTDTTESDGTYLLGVQPGAWVICEESQAGWTQTAPGSGASCPSGFEPNGYYIEVITTFETHSDKDFGNMATPDNATVSGLKFDDQNEDAFDDTDPDDPPLQGWKINAYADDGNGAATGPALATDTTDSLGEYGLTLAPGDYVICEELQGNWAQTYPDDPGASTGDCSGITGAGPEGYALTLIAGQNETDKDFGNKAGLVTGKKFDDVNRDGNKTGDSGLAGWTISAYADPDENGTLDSTEAAALPVLSTTTAGDGTYTLALQAGDYVICEVAQAGRAQSAPLNNRCKAASGAAAPGGYAIKDLDTKVDYPDRDFGNFEGALVSGLKFDDRDQNGTNAADPADPPLSGFTIKAYTDDGNGTLSVAEGGAAAFATTTTSNPEGEYFLPLPAGSYVICEVKPSGWVQTAPAPAGNQCLTVAGAGTGGYGVTVAAGDGVDAKDFGNYRTAQITVNKTYSEGNAGPVSVTLTCTSGTIVPPNPKNTPATFTVNGFAAGATCDATENPVPPGYAQDNSDCQDVELGVKTSCTIMNVKSVVLLTQGACSFDRDTNRALRQFPLIYTPEGAASKLNATNPGEFFMNAAYSGPKSQVTIKIPFPFVTASATPVHVYSGVNVHTASGKTCYSPNGPSLGHQNSQITWNYGTGGDTFGQYKTITVPVPASGFVYVRIHLKYGLKGVAGGCTKDNNNPPKATCTTMNGTTRTPSLIIGGSPTIGYQPYTFSFTDVPAGGTITQSETVESFNVFKKDPGIGGLVLQAPSNTPVANAQVKIYQGSTLKATVYTDEDGWYVWAYKYSGKATTFTVKLITPVAQQQNVTLKSNGWIVANPFIVP